MAGKVQPVETPLAGVRVLNIGTGWAGRVAAMLLADQGADVVEIVRPGRAEHPCDSLLDRGKRLLEVDLRDAKGQSAVRKLLDGADVAFENMHTGAAAGLGLAYADLDNKNKIVYISLPGFADGDENNDIPAWEGIINSAVGVYSDISPLGPLLGGDPVYSAIPMASAYGGVLGALSASLGLFHRQRNGMGQRIEVPLADAVLSAMALLIGKIEGQPARYNFPSVDHAMLDTVFPILRELREHMTDDQVARIAAFLKSRATPGLNFYACADSRILFVCAMDHVYQTRTFLETIGVFDRVIAEGMVDESPYSERTEGASINNGSALSPRWRKRLIELISASLKMRPAKEWEMLLRNANVPATVVQTASEWLSDPRLVEAGVIVDLADKQSGKVRQPGRFVSIDGPGVHSPALRPCKRTAKVEWRQPPIAFSQPVDSKPGGLLQGVRVLDFSNIIAGPAAGRTLAEHGADVIRIDSPAPLASPRTTVWFGVEVNQGKRTIIVDLKTESGREILARLIKNTDVVLHNFLDKSAQSLGIAHEQLTAINPDIISCQISAWGGSKGGPLKDDPAFDPVLQAASGIMARYGSPQKPVMHGIASCVDYITGFSATSGIAQALFVRERGRGGSYVRTSLAMGTQLVQFPFMTRHANVHLDAPSGQVARGDGSAQRLYKLADCWAFLGCRAGDVSRVAGAVGASDDSTAAIGEQLRELTLTQLRERLAQIPAAGAIAIQSLAQLRAKYTVESATAGSDAMPSGSFRLRRGAHPSGYPTTIPLATWIRPSLSPVTPLYPAPVPGSDTVAVLTESGYSENEITALLGNGSAAAGWRFLKHYLPH
jgi:crotonobetainyl-CoA:carnitine CoA-transferase CaiB-like acyl-CoA transferase